MSNLNDPFDAERTSGRRKVNRTGHDREPNLQMPSLDDQRMLIGQAKGRLFLNILTRVRHKN